MTHGEADYTKTTQAKMVAASVELDLPVILIDRFDSANFLWDDMGFPVDYDAVMEAGAAYEGDAGMALRTSAAAANANEWVRAARYAFSTPTRKLSLSTLFRINQVNTAVKEIQFYISGQYREERYDAAVRYRAVDQAWDYLNTTLGWTEFLTNTLQHALAWQRMYFEIDLENTQYIAFETADRRVDLTGTPIRSIGPAGAEEMFIWILLRNQTAGTRADASFDNIILKELGS